MILQVGQSLNEETQLLEDFRRIFGTVVLFCLVLAAFGGWLMARRSLSGVERVTQTAMAIAEGVLEKRVPLTGQGDEIDRLSGVFNHMVERIQSLIAEMKQVTDNIAHDIRSPLTRMRGLAEVTLFTGKSLDEYQTMAASTVEECDRLLGMVNTMLEISQAEAGVSPLSISEVDVTRLIEEACDLFQPLAEEKRLLMEASPLPRCRLMADKGKLQRVFANLLDNAIKYTAPGGKIAVSVEETGKDVRIVFKDTGPGIPAEEIRHIFDRFYRGDRSRSVHGAGLGLSLAQTIVRRHGGEIRVDSSPELGSTFTVALPKGPTSRLPSCNLPIIF